MRFDLNGLPPDAVITQAQLRLRCVSNSRIIAPRFYRVLRPWVENETNYTLAATGQLWDEPLAMGVGDREANPFATLPELTVGAFSVVDVTVRLRGGSSTDQNFGLLIDSATLNTVQYSLAAKEWSESDKRPFLWVRYQSLSTSHAHRYA
ncbi:MAG: DNRLRE domain-containing protein [Caldilineales bacterium]|nr:DNRLRE domain-containing protein [Caldilineales bacterium]